MAAQTWNRVNIPFPGAASSVRVSFNQQSNINVKNVLLENDNVLKLLQSEILQTEIRVLYELLHILTNNFRGIKTLKGLKQVEQCINRLKDMKLTKALEDLADVCPKRAQRALSIKAGECEVPSQPMLEWICLKVLGAAQLMSCTLSRCSRAFQLSKQQMNWEEFIILNLVISSMLSRLWVIFRGVLTSLASLYLHILELLKEVAQAQPMPFLRDFTLPADLAQILPPSESSLLTKQLGQQQQQKKKKKEKVPVKINGLKTKTRVQDLGVTVQRDLSNDTNLRLWSTTVKVPKEDQQEVAKRAFRQRVRAAATFSEIITHLQKMKQWCKSKKLEKERRCLSFLHLKCQRMKCLEAAGFNAPMKLRQFKREVCWASCRRDLSPKSRRRLASARRHTHMRTRIQLLKRRQRCSTAQTDVRSKKTKKQSKSRTLTESVLANIKSAKKISHKTTPQPSDCATDDIDDIFAFAGW